MRSKNQKKKQRKRRSLLLALLNQLGKINIKYISQLCDKDVNEVIEELKGKIYRNPLTVKYSMDKDITKGWETAEEYLSGYVVDKLAEAEAFAKEDDSYLENVCEIVLIQRNGLKLLNGKTYRIRM